MYNEDERAYRALKREIWVFTMKMIIISDHEVMKVMSERYNDNFHWEDAEKRRRMIGNVDDDGCGL